MAAGERLVDFDASNLIQTIEERRLQLEQAVIAREAAERNGAAEAEKKRVAVEKAEVEAETSATMDAWSRVPGYPRARQLQRVQGARLYVMPRPFRRNGSLYEGLAHPASRRLRVGIDHRGIASSAYAHELGHVISELDDDELAKLRDQYGIR